MIKMWPKKLLQFITILALTEQCRSSQDQLDHSFLRTEMVQLFEPNPEQKQIQGKQFFPRAECAKLLDEFSQAAANYTFCGVQHARPVNLCLKCRHPYLRVIEKFSEMEKFSQDGITCKDVLTKQDHLDIVNVVYEFITSSNGIWALGNCNNCYTDFDPAKPTANETQIYIQLLKETWNCFSQYANISAIIGDPDFSKSTEFQSLCGNCTESYYSTRKFFWESVVPFSKEGDYGSVCIDLKDAFNFTGYIWGVEFQCNTELDMGAFWILILIPFGVLIAITYGVPTFLIPWFYGSRHKVLTLLAIPDHYDRAYSCYENDLTNLREFVNTAREDGEEPLAVEAEEKLEMEAELKRIINRIHKLNQSRDERAGERKFLEAQLFDLLFEMRKASTSAEEDYVDNVSSNDVDVDSVPFVEQLRQRRIERRGQSLNQPNVDWNQFDTYLMASQGQENPGLSNNPPLLVTSDSEDM